MAADHQFEPMTVGMVLDRAFRLYTENFALMVGITAILNVPVFVLSMLSLSVSRLAPPSSLLLVLVGLAEAIIGLISLLVVAPLVTGATTKAVSDRYLGTPVTIGSALREAWSSVGTLLLTQWVAGIIVFLGLLLLIVPGVLWALSYALIAPVVIIEAADRKSRQVYTLTGETKRMAPVIMDRAEIRRRSWNLVSGNRGKVFLVMLVLLVLNILLAAGASWLANLGLGVQSPMRLIAQPMINSLINILVYPLQTIAITLLYYDFRIRKEGFDLEMLSEAMGTLPITS